MKSVFYFHLYDLFKVIIDLLNFEYSVK